MKRLLDALLDRSPDLPFHAAALLWTATLLGFGWQNTRNAHQEAQAFALAEARAASRADLAYNRWIADLGGVYVPVDDQNPAVERLAHLTDRDAKTQSGRPLSLINPGCMIRSIHESTVLGSSVHSHIIGFNPGNPENAPTDWDRRALAALAAGKPEHFEIVDQEGTNLFRYMVGLPADTACLKCHAQQGFTAGQLRGGIRIDVPMDSAGFKASAVKARTSSWGLAGVWLLGVAGIYGSARITGRRRHEAETAFAKLQEREEQYRTVIATSFDGFWVVSKDGRLLEVNDVYLRRSGYQRHELLQLRIPDLDALFDAETMAQQMEHIRAHGSAVFESVHRARDGSLWPVEVNTTYSPTRGGCFPSFLRDLSRHNRSEMLDRLRGQLADLAETESLEVLARAALDRAELMTGSSASFLHFTDPDRLQITQGAWSSQTLRASSRDPGTPRRLPLNETGVWTDGVASGTALVHNDLTGKPHRHALPEGHPAVQREIVVPVRTSDAVITLLGVANKPSPYQPADLEIVQAIAATLADALARKRTRDDLNRFFHILPDLVCIATTHGRLLRLNPEWERVLGIPTQDLLASPFLDRVHPEDRFATLLHFRRITSGRPAPPFAHRCRTAQGAYRWIEWNAAALADQQLVFGAARDVTTRRIAEQELERHRTLLETIFEYAPFMICLLTEHGEIERMNRAMTALQAEGPPNPTQLTPGHLLRCLGGFASPEGCGSGTRCHTCTLRLALTETLLTGVSQQRIEFGMTTATPGSTKELRFSASTALVSTQDGKRVLVCLEDITATRQLENQLLQAQKMEAIGQLAGGVAHDFNNIIGASMLHLHLLLQSSGISAEVRAGLKELESEARRAAALTRQLLLFSRREAAQMRRVNLDEIVGGLLKMLRRLLGEHVDISFRPTTTNTAASPNSPSSAWVEADAGMLEQVLLNLCVNARDAMPKGGSLRISTSPVALTSENPSANPEARTGAFVRLRVEDTGTGIPPEHLKHLFEPFFTTKPVGKGTGLGLATVYGIVRQHQGWIDVHSTPGVGTTFDVLLPTATLPEPNTTTTGSFPSLPAGSETLLVVEDDPGLLRTTSQLLRSCGYRVFEARNGREALRLWQDLAPRIDLLFTDVVMPGGLSGIDLASNLRASKPGLRVLMASGYSAELTQSPQPTPQGSSFLAKPYVPSTLTAAIRRCLDQPRSLSAS